MISKMEKRILAFLIACMMCVTTGYTGVVANAEELNGEEILEVSEGQKNETILNSKAEIELYRFVPKKTETYHFYSVDSGDTYGAVYDSGKNLIADASDDGKDGVDFSIETELTEGQTYYLGVDYYLDVDAGTITWVIEDEEKEGVDVKDNTKDESTDSNNSEISEETINDSDNAENYLEDEEIPENVDEQTLDGNVDEDERNWYTYLNEEGTGLIIGNYFGNLANVIIPEQLMYNGQQYPVTEIGEGAFRYNEKYTNVKISKNIEKIDADAFSYCYSLTNIDFSEAESLKIIEKNTFVSTPLKSVVIPKNVIDIGERAFYGCYALTNIDLTKAVSLRKIGGYAFSNTKIDCITIPVSVETIEENAFYNYNNIIVYGRAGTEAEEYCKSNTEKYTFRDLEGVYLEKPNKSKGAKKGYWETENNTYQLQLSWPEKGTDEGIQWSSSDESIATVAQNGLVSKMKNGTVTITVTRGKMKDSVKVKFLQPSLTSKDGIWQYHKLSDGTIGLSGYNGGKSTKVTMPDMVDGYVVTRLEPFYITKWDNVKTFILPKSVKRIEAKALMGYRGEIIIPEDNSLNYVGNYAFSAQVYGPEDISVKNFFTDDYTEYRIDKKVYMRQQGTSSDENGIYQYTLVVEHIPSNCDGEIEWSSTDTEQKICKIEKQDTEGEVVNVTATKKKGGTVTVTASVFNNQYIASLDLKFQEPVLNSLDGKFSYYITDDNKKTVTITRYNGAYDTEQIEFPSQIDGYTVTGIGTSGDNKIYANVFYIPEEITKITDGVLNSRYSLNKGVIIGKKNSTAEHYAKRNSNSVVFYTEDQLVLNTTSETLWIDASTESNLVDLKIVYAPKEMNLSELVWTSADEKIASVDANGRVTAHRAGEAIITAKCGNLSAECNVIVGNRCEGYYYRDLKDGTVEITGTYDRSSNVLYIPSELDNKKVTVIGTDAFNPQHAEVHIPDGVTTIKKHAFGLYNTISRVSIPESVVNIEEDAFQDKIREEEGEYKYIFYGVKNSVAEKYANENDNIEFIEDGLKIENDYFKYNDTTMNEIKITHLPISVDHTKDKIVWTSSDPDVVSVEYETDFEYAMRAKYKVLTDDAVNVKITCTIGKYSATIPIEIDGKKEVTSNDYTYRCKSDGTICITGYTGEASKVTIPNQLDGKNVGEIRGFEENEDLENVEIPKSVTEIAYSTFYDCTNLTSITFEKGSKLEKIGLRAFYGSGITSIIIPDSVTYIDEEAFENCKQLNSVTLSKRLKGIEASTFNGCSELSQISIPDSVTYIDSYAFARNALTSIEIPGNVMSIGYNAFKENDRLSHIVIKNKKTIIDAGVFSGCATKSLKIGQNLRSMVFSDNKKLITVTLEEGVTSIAYGAFRGCENLENIIFPKSLKKIGSSAFEGTKWYEKQPDGPLYANSILFDCKGELKKAVIKDGTTEIGEYAFGSQSGLEKIYIPSSVTAIRESAFFNCDQLGRIVIPETVKTIENNAIGYIYNGGLIQDFNVIIAGVKGSTAEQYANENGFDFEEAVPLDGVKIDQTEKTISRGESFTLTANCMPENTTEAEEIQWSSDNEQVAEVDQNGKVTAKTAGTTNIIASAGPYAVTCKVTVNVPITDDMVHILGADVNGYTGKEIRPEITVQDGSKILVNGTDYNVIYQNNVKVGTADIIVNGIGNYTGTITKHFEITPKALTDSMVTLKESEVIYTGKALTPEVTVKDGNQTLIKDLDYVVTYLNNTEIGTATVTITGKGNYKGTVGTSFTICKEKMKFKDVDESAWFYKSVKNVYDKKIMKGLNDFEFGPTQPLARAQFALILYRMNGEPEVIYQPKFPDVQNGVWYTNAILWANSIEVVNGYSNTGMFGPGDNINREQMAVMMYRYANYKGYDTSGRADISGFQDASNVNTFAKEAMEWAVGVGVITGKDNGTKLDPQGNASRAETATIITRFSQKVEN